MNKLLQILLVGGLLSLISNKSYSQCKSNMGFESGNFSSWTTSSDSLFIQPANRVYSKPSINARVVGYGVTDMYMGTMTRPNSTAGNYLTRIGNRGVRAVADTVYRKYVIDSLSDKLTIYSKGVVEQAHNYWGVPIIEAPGFGYEVYINGRKLDCLKGAFFCGNVDTPAVWQIGQFKDTAGVRKSTAWAAETLNFACYVGDTVEVRLFTRDCILLGHYAYAYFDVVCGDTTKPVINKIMLNDIIADDELTLYCRANTTLYLKPNTEVCPVFRSNVQWSPASYISGTNLADSVKLTGLDSVWVYATASFSNYCQTVNVKDSIYIKVMNFDPRDNLPKLPNNYCDCKQDTIDFGTVALTSVTDQNGNVMTLNNGKLIVQPCDNFYVETSWKNPSTRIVTRNSQIGTTGWVSGNIDGAIGTDSILATGRVRYVINYSPSKRFYAGINNNSTSNGNDIMHAIYYNGGNIRAYFNGTNLSNLGTFTGNVTIDFVTLSNRRVQIWINGVLAYSYNNSSQRATFPVYPDFSANSSDTSLVNRVYVFGPTKNVKDFTKLVLPAIVRYYLVYNDRCGTIRRDTVSMVPGFEATVQTVDDEVCGLPTVNMNLSAPNSIFDEVITTSNGNGSLSLNNGVTPGGVSVVSYSPDPGDFAIKPLTVYMTARSGRCVDNDTVNFIFNEIPRANAGPDISTTADSFLIGGAPSGSCLTCVSYKHRWNHGIALNDSTRANPMAYKNLMPLASFVLTVTDPVTTCFSMDTMLIYTSLNKNMLLLNGKCMPGDMMEFHWTLVPEANDHKFGVEYSYDFGSTWYNAGDVFAEKAVGTGIASQYALSTKKIQQGNVLYRWYAANSRGEKTNIRMIEDINCQSAAKYNVFPNPFTNQIEINIETEVSQLKANYSIQVFNQYGQLLMDKTIDTRTESSSAAQFRIDGLDDFSKGIYFINILNNFNTVYSTTIVKAE